MAMKRLSSKQAKAHAIPASVKYKVYQRDEGLCVLCRRPGNPEAHFIPRSRQGLGIEENILTLCRECHRKFDGQDSTVSKQEREGMREYLAQYLASQYEEWDEQMLVYRKE